MSEQFKKIIEQLKPAAEFVKRYVVFIFAIVLMGLFGFLVFRINQYGRTEPSEDAIQEKLQAVQRPKVDQGALDKIQQLQDQNIQVHSLFDNARNNPFNETP